MKVKVRDIALGIYLVVLMLVCVGASGVIVIKLHQALHDTYPPKESSSE